MAENSSIRVYSEDQDRCRPLTPEEVAAIKAMPVETPDATQEQAPAFLSKHLSHVPGPLMADYPESLEAIIETRRKVSSSFYAMERHLTELRNEVHEALDWRVWWGQRYAKSVPEFHQQRCQASYATLEAISKLFESIANQMAVIPSLLDAQEFLERAGDLIADKADEDPPVTASTR